MLTIGKLAKLAGVGVDTVRFYERAALLPPPERTAAGYRVYRESDVARLRFIRRAKGLGFTLEEIGELLALCDASGPRQAVLATAQRRLAALEQKIAELESIRQSLAGLVRDCDGDGPIAGCPIMDAVLKDLPHPQPSSLKP